MNFKQQTGQTIQQAFLEFHKDNPEVYKQFKHYFFYLHSNVCKKKVSSKMIVNQIRWLRYIKTTGDPYRINDAYTAHYARLFIKDYPEYKNCFELRRIRSGEQAQAELSFS